MKEFRKFLMIRKSPFTEVSHLINFIIIYGEDTEWRISVNNCNDTELRDCTTPRIPKEHERIENMIFIQDGAPLHILPYN